MLSSAPVPAKAWHELLEGPGGEAVRRHLILSRDKEYAPAAVDEGERSDAVEHEVIAHFRRRRRQLGQVDV